MQEPAEVGTVGHYVGVVVGVAEPFLVAEDADHQGHHFEVPVTQPDADGVGQCRGGFDASVVVGADEFVEELDRVLIGCQQARFSFDGMA